MATLKPWRGIESFILSFEGSLDPKVSLTIKSDPSKIGIAVYAGKEKIAVVALLTGETIEDLLAALPGIRAKRPQQIVNKEHKE